MGKNNTTSDRKVRYSIGFKLISIISLIIAVTLSGMILVASYLFRQDNELRIIENNHTFASLIAKKIETDLTSILEKANLMALTLLSDTTAGNRSDLFSNLFFAKDRDLIFIAIASKNSNGLYVRNRVANPRFLEENQLSEAAILQNITADAQLFEKSFANDSIVFNTSPLFNLPVLAMSIPYIRKSETNASSILIVYISMNKFLEAVASPNITKSFIVNDEGELIAHYDSALSVTRAHMADLPIVTKMMESKVDNGQTRYTDSSGVVFLGSFKKINFAGIGVISTVEIEKAFSAVRRIQFRNILITIIALTCGIIIVYFFAKTITRPVRRLLNATKEIEQGNYNIAITPTTQDEIGNLTHSFSSMSRGLAEREKIKDAFGKFVNKDIADQVLKGEIKLGGERKKTTILFSDIRSFTAISEKMEPEEVVDFLNEYMSLMVGCINQTHGVVDKFIGDAIMAVWGTPFSHGNDTENAINSALLMRQNLFEFNRNRGTAKKPLIHFGCGINTGTVLAGQIGSQDRMEYTVIGDPVNLASRIESLNKPFGTDILISEDAYRQVKGIYILGKMEKIRVKGKIEPQQIFAVLGRKDDPHHPRSMKELRKLIDTERKTGADFDPNAEEKKYEIVK